MSDEGWVFDSLICFLHSPAWNAALNTFIEEKSFSEFELLRWSNEFLDLSISVFDPNIEIDISNPEYVTIHDEYKNLVSWTSK